MKFEILRKKTDRINPRILLLATMVLLGACARADWVKIKSMPANEKAKMERPFVVMKGPRESSSFFKEVEFSLQQELGHRNLRPKFVRLDQDPPEGEKTWVIDHCKRMRCDYITLWFMSTQEEAPDSLTIKEKPDLYYVLSTRVIDPANGQLLWESHLDLNPSQVKGVGLTNSLYAEKAVRDLVELWQKARLIDR